MLSKKFALIIVGGIMLFSISKCSWGYTLTGKKFMGMQGAIDKAGDTVWVMVDRATHALKGAMGLKVNIKERYGIEFSDFDKMSMDEIFQFAKRFLKDQQEFIEVDLDEIVFRKAEKDSFFRWEHTDSAQWWEEWKISYSQVHKGVPVYRTKSKFNIEEDDRIRYFNVPAHPNINISTTPLISKSEAVEIAKKHLEENAKLLELPDTLVDYFGLTKLFEGNKVEISKTEALESIKNEFRDIEKYKDRYKDRINRDRNKLSKDIIERYENTYREFKERYKDIDTANTAIFDTNRISLKVSRRTAKETRVRIKLPIRVHTVSVCLKDSMELFILPGEVPGLPKVAKDSTLDYYLAYCFSLMVDTILTPTIVHTHYRWGYWIDARNGEIIGSYKSWEEFKSDPELSYIEISGPSEVWERSSANYTCTAYYTDNSTEDVTNLATWEVTNPLYVGISSNGVLTVYDTLPYDMGCRITATYESKSDYLDIIAKNLELTYIEISGPTEVDENSSAWYTCTAYYTDNSTEDVTNLEKRGTDY